MTLSTTAPHFSPPWATYAQSKPFQPISLGYILILHFIHAYVLYVCFFILRLRHKCLHTSAQLLEFSSLGRFQQQPFVPLFISTELFRLGGVARARISLQPEWKQMYHIWD